MTTDAEKPETAGLSVSAGTACWAVGPLNLNTFVRFRMKARGVLIARGYWKDAGVIPNALFQWDAADIEYRVQFHELFRMFGGHHMRHDMDGCPFYDLVVEPMPR